MDECTKEQEEGGVGEEGTGGRRNWREGCRDGRDAETRGRWKRGRAREIKNRSKMEEKMACVRLRR